MQGIITTSKKKLAILITAMAMSTALTPVHAQALDPALFDENTITVTTLVGDVIGNSINTTREHTIPGSVVALEALQNALLNSTTSEKAKSQAILRISELHLRLLGDSNSASIIAAAGRIIEGGKPKQASVYMRGIAQDLRQAGSVAAAQYLENNANLVSEGLYDARTGIMDAAAISLSYGVTPQPGLGQMLAADIDSIDEAYLRGAIIDVLNHFANVTGDEAYTQQAQQAAALTESDVERIRTLIVDAKAEQQREFDERIRTRSQPTTTNENSSVFR